MSRHDPFFDGASAQQQQQPRGSLYLAAEAGENVGTPPQGSDWREGVPLSGDPLLQALVWLTAHHGRARSAESLLAGVPVGPGALAPDNAMRVMREAGYNAGLVRKKIAEISPLLLPAVLLLKGGDACVLVRRLEEGEGGGAARFEMVFPGEDGTLVQAGADELETEFTGFVLLATPQDVSTAQTRGDTPELLREPGSHWLWGTLRRFIPYYRAAMVASLLSNVMMMASGLVTMVIYDKVIPNQSFVTLWTLAIGGALALGFDFFAKHLRAHMIDLAGRKADLIIGSKLFRQTLGVRMEHKPASAGSYAHTIAQIELVRDFFTSASMSVVSDLPFILIWVAMSFVVGGPLGWVLVLSIPIILGMTWAIQGAMRRAVRSNMTEMADLQGTLVESIEGLEDLKTSGAEGRFVRAYETSTAIAAESSMRSRAMHSLSNNLSMALQQGVTLVLLVWGVYLIEAGAVTAGALIGAVMFAGRAIAPLGSVVALAARYQGARAAMIALDAMMAKPVEREPGRNYVPLTQYTGGIGMHDVGFSYPMVGAEGAAPKVLRGVTLKIKPGERVAMLGRIGSGKSTVLRMLAGLYQPTEGSVEIDGIDMRQVDPAEYRARMGFVSQDPRLFHGTLRDNVLMGRNLDAARLVEVARLTGLDRVVANHPMGWDLPVGEMGSQLSGGQRQLVALARSLINKPTVLLMDEPTSSMDAQSEVMFLRHLREAAGEATLVVVTHRPAVLELVSRILVVDGGRLVMDGPRDQVLAALSGMKPAAPTSAQEQPSNLHLHPGAQPVSRSASV